jgi:hypothetical protein
MAQAIPFTGTKIFSGALYYGSRRTFTAKIPTGGSVAIAQLHNSATGEWIPVQTLDDTKSGTYEIVIGYTDVSFVCSGGAEVSLP